VSRPALLITGLAAAVLGAVVPIALAASSPAHRPGPPDRATAAVTAFPGLVRPTAEPTPAAILRAHPRPGAVLQAEGPFDDRFTLARLALRDATVTGTLTVTSDVSEVIDLQVLVGFYDARGGLLGTGSWEKHGEGARPDEVVRFTVAAPDAVRGRVAAAAVSVPVLVNE
jgi:hypothetical protein